MTFPLLQGRPRSRSGWGGSRISHHITSTCHYYEGTSLIRNSASLGLHSRLCLGPYGGHRGGCCFL